MFYPAKLQLTTKTGELQGWWGSSRKDLFTRQFLVRCGGELALLKPLQR